MLTMYGIRNCDSIKKARQWFDKHKVEYIFHDYKKNRIDEKTLRNWCQTVNFEELLNRRGTTWRKLADSKKKNVDLDKAITIMMANASIIKRPVVVGRGIIIVGFNQSQYESLL